MRHRSRILVSLLILTCFGTLHADAASRCRKIEDKTGKVLEVIDERERVDRASRTRTQLACEDFVAPAATAVPTETRVLADASGTVLVDARGRVTDAGRGSVPDSGSSGIAPMTKLTETVGQTTQRLTIDTMITAGWYSSGYSPGGGLYAIGQADTYHLNDGSSWDSGAGTVSVFSIFLDRVELDGQTVRYVMIPPADGMLFRQTDYNGGNHSAQGELAAAGPLEIEATIGSNIAVMRGVLRIVSNTATWYGEPRFNYYSSIVGSIVPFELTYTINGTWDVDSFDNAFTYTYSGVVDFANPVMVPDVTGLEILGSSQAPDGGASVPYVAVASFESGVQRNVTDEAVWSVDPPELANIAQGVLTTEEIQTDRETVTILAEYTNAGTLVEAAKSVDIIKAGSADLPTSWEMYQGDARHTGYAGLPVEPDVFTVRWQRTLADRALNPVTAADGRVFASVLVYFHDNDDQLYILDDRDGETLWSMNFGRVFSVNPPSYAYGNVYIQTGNHGSDTYLHAFDAETGVRVFQAPHSAQWERYYAPTIHQGSVFVNGGYYGGMYGFDAFSGQELWFLNLPQYDEWTPAVDEAYVYAHVDHSLYVVNRGSGTIAYTIADPNFDWHGWDMDLAPILGGLDDVLTIQSGRLVSFDLGTRAIRFELDSGFRGQPAIAGGVIYAIDHDALVAIDQATGANLWSWDSTDGILSGNVIVTDTHVFVTSSDNLFAIEILSHSDVWTYPVSGHISLSDEVLYVAGLDGVLTAINMPEYTPAALDRIEVTGPSTVLEMGTAQYTATAYYDDGRVRDRTALTDWNVDPTTYASIDEFGTMTTVELLEPSVDVSLRGRYTEGDVARTDGFAVELRIGVTIREFIERNVEAAANIKQQILDDLDQALVRERAARSAAERWVNGEIGVDPPSCWEWRCLLELDRAILTEERAADDLRQTIADLIAFLRWVGDVHGMLPRGESATGAPEALAPAPK